MLREKIEAHVGIFSGNCFLFRVDMQAFVFQRIIAYFQGAWEEVCIDCVSLGTNMGTWDRFILVRSKWYTDAKLYH